MKRTCSSKPSLRRRFKNPTKKANCHGKLSTLSIKKTDHYRPTYRTRTRCSSNNYSINKELFNNEKVRQTSSSQQEDVDLTLLSALRQEAYDELHRQMQQYNDSFVFEMQQVELQQQKSTLTAVDDPLLSPQRRRSSLSAQFLHHHSRRSSLALPSNSQSYHNPYTQQEEIGELVDLLETGTIKDYSLLTEWELCQNQQSNLDEEQGGLGDMW